MKHKDLGKDCLLPHIGSIDDHVEVLVNVVHDLGLEEGLGTVIHDLVAKLGLGDVLPQLLDASAPGLFSAALVNDLVTLVLGSLPIFECGYQLLDYLELSAEEWILYNSTNDERMVKDTNLVRVHDVVVHLEDVTVDPGHRVQEAVKGGCDLKLLEEAGDHTSRGGAGQTNLTNQRLLQLHSAKQRHDLVIDDDRRHDSGPGQGGANHVEVLLGGGRGVTGWDLDLHQAWIGFLESSL